MSESRICGTTLSFSRFVDFFLIVCGIGILVLSRSDVVVIDVDNAK